MDQSGLNYQNNGNFRYHIFKNCYMNKIIIPCIKYCKKSQIIIYTILLISCQKGTITSDSATRYFDDLYHNIEFEMPVVNEPEFKNYTASIVDFGAVPGGNKLNTDAINQAILDVSKNGGGKVIVPRGIWLTGPIVLKNNVNLHVEEGALLLFSRNYDDYPLIHTSFEGLETFRCQSPISGTNLENIAITGKGIIDGSGDTWRPVKKSKLTELHWKELIQSGGVLNENKNVWYPTEKSLQGALNTSSFNVPAGTNKKDFENVKDFLRPVMVSLIKCNKVLLDGPTFQNSPAWNIHPLMCEDITLKNLTIRNPWYSQNGDGIDLESCKNAIIYRCNFDVGDDAICIKSGKNENGRKRGIPTENTIVKECVVYHGHGGFVIGSEMSGGVRNMHVSQCTFIGTDVGLRFKSNRGRGGVVENIYISDIIMTDIPTEAIRFNLYYDGQSPIPEPEDTNKIQPEKASMQSVTEGTPEFKNIYVKNIACIDAAKAIRMVGLPEMKLNNFRFENISITAKKGAEIIDAENIKFKNTTIKCEVGPVITIDRSSGIEFDSLSYENNESVKVKLSDDSKDILFKNTYFENPERMIQVPDNNLNSVVVE